MESGKEAPQGNEWTIRLEARENELLQNKTFSQKTLSRRIFQSEQQRWFESLVYRGKYHLDMNSFHLK